jgi:hypothetical protein
MEAQVFDVPVLRLDPKTGVMQIVTGKWKGGFPGESGAVEDVLTKPTPLSSSYGLMLVQVHSSCNNGTASVELSFGDGETVEKRIFGDGEFFVLADIAENKTSNHVGHSFAPSSGSPVILRIWEIRQISTNLYGPLVIS